MYHLDKITKTTSSPCLLDTKNRKKERKNEIQNMKNKNLKKMSKACPKKEQKLQIEKK